MDADRALAHVMGIARQVAAAHRDALKRKHGPAHLVVGKRVPDILERLPQMLPRKRKRAVKLFVRRFAGYGSPLVEGSTVHFIFYSSSGRAKRVTVPGDLNGWNPRSDPMLRIRGTGLFHLAKEVPRKARFEYKFALGGTWVLDPCNKQRAVGGSGSNSEVWMPGYRPPSELRRRRGNPAGTIGSFSITSRILQKTYPVFVYLPHGIDTMPGRVPSLYVLDGGDYLSLALMTTVLDNMIARRRIPPVAAIFVEPRTDVTRPRTNRRTTHYTMSDPFVRFLANELRPELERRFPVSRSARNRGIMGASLGGLQAFYAAYRRPDVFSRSAAQSPSFWWKQEAMILLLARGPRKPVRFSLDTGTMDDCLEATRAARDVLEKKGYRFRYCEHPEGHNWGHWRAYLPQILEYFWGTA